MSILSLASGNEQKMATENNISWYDFPISLYQPFKPVKELFEPKEGKGRGKIIYLLFKV